MSSTVLITTANQPPKGVPYLEMTDAAIRCVTAKASVFFWAAQGIEKIVIADATGGTLLDSNEVLLLKQINVDVEQISYFQDEQQLRLKGKGFPRIRSSHYGDQLVKVQINTPKKITRSTKRLIDDLKDNLYPIDNPFRKIEL